ncbi:hypothetical protein MLD38_015616 [Melastoma candidum]|uniref:Uncharacterized protein n=1 Tax=Melastoma candidum TaxID=119954 RepID=A0ACB9RJS5_9MYRT|nr:hypothetical protein MLD38_015616 [Melastoma candidum]
MKLLLSRLPRPLVKLRDFGSAKLLVKGEPSISYICQGCVLAELLLGQPLFPGECGVDQLVEIIKGGDQVYEPQLHGIQIFHKRMPPEAVDLVSRLLQYSPHLRCSAFDALTHKFFNELRDPNARLPNGRFLPPLFNFKSHGVPTETLLKLIPEHARKQGPSLAYCDFHILVLSPSM